MLNLSKLVTAALFLLMCSPLESRAAEWSVRGAVQGPVAIAAGVAAPVLYSMRLCNLLPHFSRQAGIRFAKREDVVLGISFSPILAPMGAVLGIVDGGKLIGTGLADTVTLGAADLSSRHLARYLDIP